MWDCKNTVNQCVKCFGKFTSTEQPLKLLPCLHSMCLDCLYGRFPTTRQNTPQSQHANANNTNSDSKTEGSEEANSESKNKTQNGDAKDTEDDDSVTVTETASEAEKNGETEPVPVSTPVSNKEDAPNGDTTTTTVDDSSKPKDEAEQKETDKLPSTSPDVNNAQPETQNSDITETPESEKKIVSTPPLPEPEDVKPKPATECPVCHDPIDQPGMTLMDNMFATLAPNETLSASENSTHVCTACEEGQQAISYCVQCEEWLCDSCVDAHKRVRVTKDHVISPKDEVQVTTTKSPWEQLMVCKQHKQEQLKFFCEKCEKLTCRDCQLMDHKDHKYQFLDQAAELYRARLKGSLALMGDKRTKLTTNRDEIEQKLTNCKEQKDSLQQDILRQADILVKGIRQAVWSVLSNLASFTDAATKRLNKEIDDVADLIRKFDHCIQFMEDVLSNGSSMSLLYSKGNVEAKCRKVYHTQVDPQSLKGTLLIQYKQDVNWLLGNLNKIGAIFVNGVRYPPEKNGGQANRHAANSNQYSSDQRGGISGTSPHLQHMANQVTNHQVPGQRGSGGDWNKYIQTANKPSGQIPAPPNMTLAAMGSNNSLPPQLTLPSNRRTQSSAMGPQWQAAMPNSNFPPHFQGQMHQPQAQAIRPSFTPMRLHHRPAAHPSSFPNQPDHGQNMRSPPQYRMGGEASGTSRTSHGTPDPARPASAGMYDANRPDSGGGPAIVDIKKERRDQSPDCVITSSSMRNEKPMHHHTSPSSSRLSETVLEMQRNLDDVIRNVPMDLSDNLEQISTSKPTSEVLPAKTLASPPPLVASETREQQHSPTDEELRENWQGGNSMPGFSLAPISQTDPNDDYCACCHNGGDVLCCDTCPKVYHLQCHIPELPSVPSGSFVCTICEGDKSMNTEEAANSGKRKAPGGLSDHDVKVCERILLELFCHPSSVPFQEPVNRAQVPNYYKIITQPMDFTQIKCKLQRKHNNHYQSIKAFLYDLRQVFINCALYNKGGSEVGKAGKIVRDCFECLVEQLMPVYLSFVKENPSPIYSAIHKGSDPELGECVGPDIAAGAGGPQNGDETQAKRIKLDAVGAE